MFDVQTLNEQVDNQIKELPVSLRAKFLSNMELLAEFGNKLGEPYVSAFGDGLFELRAKGKEGIARGFFTFQKDKIVIIFHCFIKKSQKTPRNELQKARKILSQIKGGK
ncbi:hypothetical protein CQA49_08195 [Helicobacter sp. MIT 00-7814]|uniref:type II toxin-antitoxin system RelE/ParE family toxin n=1 Tax=unclassified Helicobacter TaxID=2593540 RepID=UPI000E1F89FA|nr:MULTISPECIES: type II toxin-antitoxin system RelE/ParE family toxin [unclassified Helicobacter]RDU51595.1 hypothetical protein CQA37_09560 [Helicobacter sp. MIT 99-10781]RDU52531.1 hypothetical protein CQA49_08195 [Helicobacter sp. MIT 00-7814]